MYTQRTTADRKVSCTFSTTGSIKVLQNSCFIVEVCSHFLKKLRRQLLVHVRSYLTTQLCSLRAGSYFFLQPQSHRYSPCRKISREEVFRLYGMCAVCYVRIHSRRRRLSKGRTKIDLGLRKYHLLYAYFIRSFVLEKIYNFGVLFRYWYYTDKSQLNLSDSTSLNPPLPGIIEIRSDVSTSTRYCSVITTTDGCDWLNVSSFEVARLTRYVGIGRVGLKKEVDLFWCVHVMTLLASNCFD